MGVLEDFSSWLVFGNLGFQQGTAMGEALNFFIYDTIKIGLLLIIINYVMAVVRYYFPLEKARDILTKRRWFGLDYLFAALLGVVTPFCSCSSIPLFIGFLEARIPLGVTFAFLISSPLINEATLYLFPAIFGFKVAILYNVMGIIIAMLGGFLIQRLNLERFVNPDLMRSGAAAPIGNNGGGAKPPLRKLAAYWWADGWRITKQIFPYVVLGVGIGAAIHGFVPQSFIEQHLSAKTWWSVPVAVLVGAPLYANSVGIIPILEALADKGVPLGNLLAFMTGLVVVSIPEIIILNRVLRWQLMAAFVGVTLAGAIIIGYVFNAIT